MLVEVEKDRVVMKPKPKSYTAYTLGLHKKVWKGVEVEMYLEGNVDLGRKRPDGPDSVNVPYSWNRHKSIYLPFRAPPDLFLGNE